MNPVIDEDETDDKSEEESNDEESDEDNDETDESENESDVDDETDEYDDDFTHKIFWSISPTLTLSSTFQRNVHIKLIDNILLIESMIFEITAT